jgi:DNA-binding CsgD family transcriptional regulator/PAS domain-containing protein
MDDSEKLSALIGDIYDATLDPSLWMDVLCKASRFVGGPAASLFSKDATSKTGSLVYGYGIEPRYRQLYFEHYVKLDPLTTAQVFSEIEEPIAMADVIPYDEFLQTRFYREWARPQGLVDFVSSVLDKSVTSAAMFGVFRHERDGVVDDATRQRMRLIVPHIRRAVLVARLIDLKQTEAATFADTLDGLSAGLFLVDATGRIVHANAAAHGILAADDFLRTISGRLVARDAQIDQSLREIFTAAGCGDIEIGIKGIALPLAAHDGERYVAHVLPLTSGARRGAGMAYTAAAALFVRKATMETPTPPEVIAKTFKLTPTELRVLLAIVEVGGVPDVAAALGVAETTIKTHLGHLFEKTGVNRQVDLVKLVAGFSSPMAG